MLARGIRFADVFVPGAMTNVGIGGVTVPSMQGVWRRVIYFGRGIGGKYVTALDVTAPGPVHGRPRLDGRPDPAVEPGQPRHPERPRHRGRDNGSGRRPRPPTRGWARPGRCRPWPTSTGQEEPDLQDHAAPATASTSRSSWARATATPPAARARPTTRSTRSPATSSRRSTSRRGGEQRPDADTCAPTSPASPSRRDCSVMPNALVANSVGFNRSAFEASRQRCSTSTPTPGPRQHARLHRRPARAAVEVPDRGPDVAIPAADLGRGPAGRHGRRPPRRRRADAGDHRARSSSSPRERTSAASGPFRSFSLRRRRHGHLHRTTGTGHRRRGHRPSRPVVKLFARTFDQGDPEANCGYPTEARLPRDDPARERRRVPVAADGTASARATSWSASSSAGTRLSLPEHQVRAAHAARLRHRRVPLPVAVRLDPLRARRADGPGGLRPERQRRRRVPRSSGTAASRDQHAGRPRPGPRRQPLHRRTRG